MHGYHAWPRHEKSHQKGCLFRIVGFPGVQKTNDEADPSGANSLQTVPAIAAFDSNRGLMCRKSLGILAISAVDILIWTVGPCWTS